MAAAAGADAGAASGGAERPKRCGTRLERARDAGVFHTASRSERITAARKALGPRAGVGPALSDQEAKRVLCLDEKAIFDKLACHKTFRIVDVILSEKHLIDKKSSFKNLTKKWDNLRKDYVARARAAARSQRRTALERLRSAVRRARTRRRRVCKPGALELGHQARVHPPREINRLPLSP